MQHMSAEQFQRMGRDLVAYVRPMRSEDVHLLYPEAPELVAGNRVFLLCCADGTPIMITDSMEAALAGAFNNDLHTVGVH